MNYDAATNKVVLATTDCICSYAYGDEPGKRPGSKACPTCKGTGKGPRGGARGCRSCHGFRTAPDFDNLVTCSNCDGTAIVPEDIYDKVSGPLADVVKHLPIIVRRVGRSNNFNENYLGLGYLYSSTDYGDAFEATDADVEAKVRTSLDGYHQTTNFVRSKEDLTLVDAMLVVVTRNGYSVRGVFTSELRG